MSNHARVDVLGRKIGNASALRASSERRSPRRTTAFLPDDCVVKVDTHRAMVRPHDVIADERTPDKWHCLR
jgi:hypothetical protein